MIEGSYSEWISRVEASSAMYLDQYLSYRNGDVDDWEGKAWAYYTNRKDEGYSGVLFEGDKGTGKHTALSSFLNVYSGSDGLGYQAVFFDSLSLPASTEEYILFEKYVIGLVNALKADGKSSVIVIDELDSSKCTQYILRLLPSLTFGTSSEGFDLIYFVISRKLKEVPSLFSRLTCRLVFANTTADQRKRYIERIAPSLKSNSGFLADTIGDCTYGELTDIVRLLSLETTARHPVQEDEIRAIADKYVKTNFAKNTPHPMMDLFFERLTAALSSAPRAVITEPGTSVQVSAAFTNDPTDFRSTAELSDSFDPAGLYSSRKKEYEDMPPHDLLVHLWGEEGVQEIIKSAENY